MIRSTTLPEHDRAAYADNGFVLDELVFDEAELDVLRKAAEEELTTESPRRSVDQKTGVPYRAHGSHEHHDVFHQLVRDPRLLGTAQDLLDDDVYVHQLKINSKVPFTGEQWGWHQDFTFWHLEDGMPEPRALSAAVLLDDVTEFNSPLIVVPGAHRTNTLVTPARSDGWSATTTNALKYNLADSPELPNLVREHGMVAPKAAAGSVLWFHCNIPHASGNNMAPYGRMLVLISYNAVSNALPAISPRPEWLIGRDFTPLQPSHESLNLQHRGGTP